MNEYLVTSLVTSRLAEARRYAAEQAMVDFALGPRPGLRTIMGQALVAAGQWLIGPATPVHQALR